VIDPCISTSITAEQAKVEDLVAFAGYTAKTKIRYKFDDVVSIALTLSTDQTDFCGEKQLDFLSNGTTTTDINAQNSDFIYFSPSSETTNFGTGLATV
jgi:hypothetical protein